MASRTPGYPRTPEDFSNLILLIHTLSPFPTITCLVSTMHFDIIFHFHAGMREAEGSYREGSASCSVVWFLHNTAGSWDYPASVEQVAWGPQTGCPALTHTSVLGGEWSIPNLGRLVDSNWGTLPWDLRRHKMNEMRRKMIWPTEKSLFNNLLF